MIVPSKMRCTGCEAEGRLVQMGDLWLVEGCSCKEEELRKEPFSYSIAFGGIHTMLEEGRRACLPATEPAVDFEKDIVRPILEHGTRG